MHLTGIPASITLAQGIIESGAGKSPLALDANNHFGIKCHDDWKGDGYKYDDDRKNECFRKYDSAYQSFCDHSQFLKTRQRYAVLFTYDSLDYKSWAKGLKACGYATNPKYADILIKCIDDYDLHQWDLNDTERTECLHGSTKVIARKPFKARK
jgi:flagellum-specific peptidoglycan hydrolase FlgJ